MATMCELCRKIRSTVYCRAEAISLCLSCDRDVHGANGISKRHLRTLLCDGCGVESAAFNCNNHKLSFCHNCDRQSHSNSPQHKRTSISYYTGCPSAAELAKLWSRELDGLGDDEKQGPDVPGIGLDGSLDSLNLSAGVHAGFKHNLGSWMEPVASPSVAVSSNGNTMISMVAMQVSPFYLISLSIG
jgi:hypothetical protein